jgi:putative NIF3 family GTP cyclohydrolase 1 type 2
MQSTANGADRFGRIGLCPGAGGSLVAAARAAGCHLFITGEMKHHEILAASALGLHVLLAGHTQTERGYLPNLRDRLANIVPAATFAVSRADIPPTRRI